MPRQRWAKFLLGSFLGGSLLSGGCATGQTAFKVVSGQNTPTPVVTAEPTVTPPLSPAQPATSSGPASAASSVTEYTVGPGESLWRISRRLLGDGKLYIQVAQANHISDPALIQPGQKIKIDLAWKQSAAAPISVEKENRAPATRVAAPESKPAPTAAVVFPLRPNAAFKAGEHLLFAVQYFGMAAGFASLDVENGGLKFGRQTYRLVATAWTHPAFEWIFKVRDRIESYFDQQGLFSWQYEKHLREGGYSNDTVMIYDQIHRQVIKDEGKTTLPAGPWVQDVLSEFYYFRTLKFALGDTVTVPVLADDGKAYELLVKVVKKERMTVPAGTFDCIVVEPALKFEGLFQQKGKVAIWLTDDEHRVPVLIKTQIVIGTIDIVLRDARVVE